MDRGWGLQIPGQSISSEQWLSGQTQLPSQLSGNFIKKSQFTGNLKKVMSAFLVNEMKAVSPTPDFRYYQWYLVTETAFNLLMSRYLGRLMTLWWRAFRDTEFFTKMQMKICFWEKTDNTFKQTFLGKFDGHRWNAIKLCSLSHPVEIPVQMVPRSFYSTQSARAWRRISSQSSTGYPHGQALSE